MDDLRLQKSILADIKKQEFLNNIMKEIKILFKKQYGSLDNAIGIFGRYITTISTIEGDIGGEDLIMKLGKLFAKEDFIAITGEGIFFKKNKIINKCKILTKKIKREVIDSPEHLWDFSRCLASIPTLALFLLTPERSSSQKEEEEFFKNRFEDNKLCIVALFLQESPNKCNELIKKEDYYICCNNDFEVCKKNVCPFINQGRIPAGDMENFVKTGFSKLMILKSYKPIPKIFTNLKRGV